MSMEKQAAVKQAASSLEKAMRDVGLEMLENIKTATHNRDVIRLNRGHARRYKTAAYRKLKQEVAKLIELASHG